MNNAKYSVGDFVYISTYETDSIYVECPDCLGKGTWKCFTPAGSVFNVYCLTCNNGGMALIHNPESFGKIRNGYTYRPVVLEGKITGLRYQLNSTVGEGWTYDIHIPSKNGTYGFEEILIHGSPGAYNAAVMAEELALKAAEDANPVKKTKRTKVADYDFLTKEHKEKK